jgi:hypothetical protein
LAFLGEKRSVPPRRRSINPTVEGIREEFLRYRKFGERALGRLDDDAFFHVPAPDGNSAAILVKHLGGNLRSRWTDFLTTDGEKPDRRRDTEFELSPEDTRDNLMARWDAGWDLVASTLDRLSDEDLRLTVQLRGQRLTVGAAALRQLAHAAYHVGQIVLLARARTSEWESLTIPRGASEAFIEQVRNQ